MGVVEIKAVAKLTFWDAVKCRIAGNKNITLENGETLQGVIDGFQKELERIEYRFNAHMILRHDELLKK